MQSITRVLAQVLSAVVMGLSAQSFADDTDIYSGNTSAGVPNLLFLFDSAANFSASAPTCTYASGGAPTLNGTAGGIQQCALVDVIEALPSSGTVNIGLMSYNANGITSGAATGVGPCEGSNGGCLLKPFTLMDAAGKTEFVNFIKSWRTSGGTDASNFNIKTNSEATGALMQEAWAYFNGKIGMSGKDDYGDGILDAGCQKNFIIFIGNSLNASGTPGDGSGDADPNNSSTGLPSAQVQATADLKTKLSNTVKFDAPTCPTDTAGRTSPWIFAPATNASSDWSANWADEWARLMYEQDASETRDGVQNVISYTVGVVDPAACKYQYPALLKNMADYGGGKYYQSSNASDVKNAILKILNEVQAVNSVFASSSLPVSVNAQGTYLNQIYMGMFRPDGTANPRWAGNLKQYSFIFDPDGDLVLGDAIKNAALSSAGKGFLAPDAISFWTCSNASNPYLDNLTDAQQSLINSCPDGTTDPANGFWQNYPTVVEQSAGKGYDLADGEYVEKGGVAQQIRLKNLTHTAATYTAGSDTRKVYTYCPSETGCVANLTDASNAFSVNNAGISAALFGASTQYKVVSIVRTGTTATVTTLGNHGFATGAVVTITGATDSAYNGSKTITVPSGSTTTFTFGGLDDFPPTPSTGTYNVQLHALSSALLSSLTRTSDAASTSNLETALAETIAAHGFATGNTVVVTGATGAFSGSKSVTVTSLTGFEYPVAITPRTPSQNAYTVQRPSGDIKIVSISAGNTPTVTTQFNHGFTAGQSVVISGTGNNKYDKTVTVATPSGKTFQFSVVGNPTGYTGTTGAVTGPSQAVSVAAGNIRRTGTGATATATVGSVTALPSNVFYSGAQLQITKSAGTATDESAYAGSVTITCPTTACTTFTYTVDVLPGLDGGAGSISAALGSVAAVPIGAGQITRAANGIATVTGIPADTFANLQAVDILVSGTAVGSEVAYTASPAGGWPITCTSPCTSFTFGPVAMTPVSPAEGAQINVYSTSVPPDKDSLIKWVRGQDNFGDEPGPGGTVTVRPTVHGDVLHSRPLVLNYGDNVGVVVYYGDNGGVFRAINGNKVNKADTPTSWGTPGSEIWGFIPSDMFGKLNRQRLNEPDLLLPSTPDGIDPQPLRKDYFIDGPTGVYQLFDRDGDGNLFTAKAVLYMTMRRGGNFLYAIDVTNPAVPQVLWVKENASPDMGEIGQTWSLPKVALVKGRFDMVSGSPVYRPVVIFGAGYDPAEDQEPPVNANVSMGRGIYVLDAVTGELIWKATYGASTACTSGTVTSNSGTVLCTNSAMRYSVPSDITLVDRDRDGFIDRFYFGDTGGNLWRTDLEPDAASPLADTWKLGLLAKLGCNDGTTCGDGKAPRKIFFPPEVITTTGYDAVFVITGDREHPLDESTPSQTPNRVFMVKDVHTGKNMQPNPAVALVPIVPNDLVDVSYRNCVTDDKGTPNEGDDTTDCDKTVYTGQDSGYSINLAAGEKGVNAPLVVAGSVFFGTNVPKVPDPLQCTTNLGEARGYRLNPFTGDYGYVVFDSEGLPPSPVAGVVQVEKTITNNDGTTTTSLVNVAFGIGLGAGHETAEGQVLLPGGDEPCTGADCKSAFGGGEPPINVNASRYRTYWYIENK